MEHDKKKQKEMKRKRRDVFGYGSGEDISDSEDEEDGASAATKGGLKRKVKESQQKYAKQDLGKLQGQSASAVISQMEKDKKRGGLTGAAKKREMKAQSKTVGGHRVVQSGSSYQSEKGKGDVLKAGKHEPYAYFQLNPDMLNPRKKKQAIQTFEGVVSHGKKTDKRSGKKITGGALSGLAIKKK